MNLEPPVEPKEISINILHASSIRAMSKFIERPSAELAGTIVKLLNALAHHPERFVAPCGYDIYSESLQMWSALSAQMRYCQHWPAKSSVH